MLNINEYYLFIFFFNNCTIYNFKDFILVSIHPFFIENKIHKRIKNIMILYLVSIKINPLTNHVYYYILFPIVLLYILLLFYCFLFHFFR